MTEITDWGCLPKEPRRQKREFWQKSQLWHGMPKIGKTTLASQFPNPMFLLTEEGLGDLEVAAINVTAATKRIPTGPGQYKESFIDEDGNPGPSGWEKIKTAIHDLTYRPHPYQTLIVDTVPGMFLQCVKYFNVTHGVEYENDGQLGYGKGSALIVRDFADTLAWMAKLPMGLIFIAHSREKEITVPGSKGKDKVVRIVSTLPDKALEVVNGLVDMIFYMTFDGTGERVIKTHAGLAYDAGSRTTLPETIPMSYEALVAAHAMAVGGNGNVKGDVIRRIRAGEQILSDRKIDNFDTEKRMVNSREKHAGNADLVKCELTALESYLQHLQVKFKKGTPSDGTPGTTA